MKLKLLSPLVTSFTCAILFTAANAQENPVVRKAAILTAQAESAVTEAGLIKDRLGSEGIEFIEFHSTYSDRDFLLQLKGKSSGGKEINISYNGYLWDQGGNNMQIIFAGMGIVGEEKLRLNGQSIWQYDEKKKDYTDMDFRQVTKFGDHSFWGWVLGTEIIVGGTIGGAGAVATATLSTGGAAIGVSPWIAAVGAGAGASALVGVSEGSKSLLSSDEPTRPPATPARPRAPEGNLLLAGEGKIYTAVSHGGSLFASSINGEEILTGDFDDKYGEAKGMIRSSIKK